MRDKLAPELKTVVLSNSPIVSSKEIRESLSKLEVRIMKLDCGLPEIFKKYNQPCPGVVLEQITEGLAQLPDVIIQTLFTSGRNGNF